MSDACVLEQERSRVRFSREQLSDFIYGGAERRQHVQSVWKSFEEDPAFDKRDRVFLNHQQAYERSLSKMYRFHTKAHERDMIDPDDISIARRAVDEVLPNDVHMSMFIPTLMHQTSDEQRQKWLPLALNCGILGAYAQTELGHGSNVRGLETTATYDPSTQEFDIHSPTLNSTKWWPGGLGKTATHAVVYARLLLAGKDYGIHAFIVQLRSLQNHKPLSGVEVGDIGPKVGFNTIDNGFARFNHVRIPRDQMLMGYAKVTPEGQYVPPKHAKVGYATMIHVRANIIMGSSLALSRGLTIAIRYSIVRKQGVTIGKRENQVIDYQSQQWVLFPLLSAAYALHFIGVYMRDLYNSMVSGLKKQDTSILAEVHGTSSGLKGMVALLASDGLERLRKSMGGHGYSQFSGITEMAANYLSLCTLEGTLEVLAQQTTRYLLKSLKQASKLPPSSLVGYLGRVDELLKYKAPSAMSVTSDVKTILTVFEARAARIVVQVARASTDAKLGYNDRLVDILRASQAHCEYVLVRNFFEGVEALEIDAKPVLRDLSLLFAMTTILERLGEFRDGDVLSCDQAAAVRARAYELLPKIRPNALALTEAWGFSDKFLNSALGASDGEPYRKLYERALQDPMNARQIPEGYEKYIKPLIQQGHARSGVELHSKL
eukprot:m.15414 g.15414  ORF g.15414 m.15414 type:complete len:660 (+) comp9727_c0_seq1:41-2020(+)